MISRLHTRTLPLFVFAAVLGLFALVVLDGTAEAIVFIVAFAVLLGASIRYIGRAVRDDPVSRNVVSRDGLIGGVNSGLSTMTAGESKRRRRKR